MCLSQRHALSGLKQAPTCLQKTGFKFLKVVLLRHNPHHSISYQIPCQNLLKSREKKLTKFHVLPELSFSNNLV